MADIVVLKSGLDVTPVLTQLSEYADDWNTGSKMAGTQSLLDDRWGFPAVEAGVLQLIMGVITEQGQFVGDSELSKPTDAYYRHNKVREILADNGFPELERCGFLSLPVGGSVGTHIDTGDYYETRDRFHLSIQSTYNYDVGNDGVRIEPGTLFWFDNKQPHGAKNVGDDVRITFVFDVLRNKHDYDLPRK